MHCLYKVKYILAGAPLQVPSLNVTKTLSLHYGTCNACNLYVFVIAKLSIRCSLLHPSSAWETDLAPLKILHCKSSLSKTILLCGSVGVLLSCGIQSLVSHVFFYWL